MGMFDDPNSESYTGAQYGAEEPAQRPPGIPDDWEWDPLQGVYVPAPSVIGAPVQPTAEPTPDPDPGKKDGPAPTTPVPTPVPGGGSLITPFPGTGSAPDPTPASPLPTVGSSLTTIPGGPPIPTLPRFMAPTLEEAMNEPGWKFAYDKGANELKNWLGAHGTFNDSSAAEALQDYGQNAAATQYKNVWDRKFNAYQSDIDTQYLTPWQMAYQNWATGTVGPTTTQFTTLAPLTAARDQNVWQNRFNNWLQDWNIFRDQRDSTFDKQFAVATA